MPRTSENDFNRGLLAETVMEIGERAAFILPNGAKIVLFQDKERPEHLNIRTNDSDLPFCPGFICITPMSANQFEVRVLDLKAQPQENPNP